MPRPATDKRDRLTGAALDLAYRRGFERASIADIARAADVAPGSVYYYFKTKDDVGQAIVDALGTRYRGAMESWSELASPVDRIMAFVDSYRDQSTMVMEHGCPLGSVVVELSKQSADLGAAAGGIFAELVDWMAAQFGELGFSEGASHARGMHVIAVMQGAASLANALGSAEPITREADYLDRWVRRSGA